MKAICNPKREAECFVGLVIASCGLISLLALMFSSMTTIPQPYRMEDHPMTRELVDIAEPSTRDLVDISVEPSTRDSGDIAEPRTRASVDVAEPSTRDLVDVAEPSTRDSGHIAEPGNKTEHSRQVKHFHKRYNVNCKGLLHGDNATISRIGKNLNSMRNVNGSLKVPSDLEVSQWLKNCDFFKDQRGYSSIKPLKMEEDFPIAYVISAHESAAQVERLLRAIYNPANVYCIHPDAKSPPAYQRAIRDIAKCFDNVIIASKPVSVLRYNISLVLCDLICMEDLLKFSPKWKYLINLCGTDFPMKTNKEIVQFLQSLDGHNAIEGDTHEELDDISVRWRYHYINRNSSNVYPKNTLIEKEPPPHNITMYKGNRYIAGTRKFIDFIVNSQIAKDFLVWLKDTLIPDESFTASLHRYPSAPGSTVHKQKAAAKMRYIKWVATDHTCDGKAIHHVCIFNSSHLQHLYTAEQMFVNKLHYGYDPVTMQCLEDLIDQRSRIER